MTRIPLWRQFEDASIPERCVILGGCNWRFFIRTSDGEIPSIITHPNDTKDQAIEHYKNWLIKHIDSLKKDIKKYELKKRNKSFSIYNNFSDIIANRIDLIEKDKFIISLLESDDTEYRWIKELRQSPKYKSLVNSFYGSKEWKQFRLSWLEKHPVCFKCGEIKKIMQVHHKDRFNLSNTILYEGFLEPLRDTNRFQTLCHRCHAIEEGYIIIAAIENVLRWPQNILSDKGPIVEIQPPEGFKSVIRISMGELSALSLDERKKLMEDEGWV